MKKVLDKQNRFAFRKLKIGLVSVAVAFVFGAAGQVAAEETAVSETAPSVVSETNTGAVEAAAAEIAEKAAVPVVAEENAAAGDVIDVSVTESGVTASEEGNVSKAENTITVRTTSIADPAETPADPNPSVTVTESTSGSEDDNYSYTIYERVTKTSTEEFIQEADQIRQTETTNADIVFVIDHSISMDVYINQVKTNIRNFVNGLQDRNISVRLGLVDYEDHRDTNYAGFTGSYFTNDVAQFIAALDAITTAGSFEEATVPLTYIATPGNYDWSVDPNARRFAILITDEDIDYLNDSPSLESTIQALNAANISTTVIASNYNQDVYMPLVNATGGIFIDISSDFSTALSDDISTWVVEASKGRLLKVVTDQYDFYVEIVAIPKDSGAATATNIDPSKAALTVKAESNSFVPVHYQTEAFAQQEAALPQTGEKNQAYLVGFGTAAVSLALGMALKSKRNRVGKSKND
ncbi:VWA domain-containing protein [Streptococcus pantholopis]|uniref:VWFA domain-containing protein n=1 Tax=Streptococcus pantholopis TaxID=1811193 RepID=A0A172Q7P1_9STRE|nr:VWA domain-containing protein [Streptococcus pantholopis]AND79476.1 hypothetical protein A0O21_05260 [Streptococcus pantholopis]